MPDSEHRRSAILRPGFSSLLSVALFGGLWWVLAEGAWRAWGVGAVTVIAAVAASHLLWPPRVARVSPVGLAAFLFFFLWQSLRGGLVVAALALRPRLRLRPDLHELDLRLPPGPARVLLADALSLMPGTVSAGLAGDTLTVHLLDRGLVTEADLRQAEGKVAALFGLKLSAGEGGEGAGD
ncbi:MAG TPA: cation transporter [Thioalkalivibrio sp.]|nr:cation transporter [Thioalkalivibrio sp.]